MFLALALIVSLLEGLLPPIVPMLPYAKLGLGNVVLLTCFLLLGAADGYIVLILKCLLAAVFAGNLSSLMWSLPSALVAYAAMVALHAVKIKGKALFSTAGLSVAGGMLHNVTQIGVAALIVGTTVFAYLPYMLLAGGLAGLVTGVLCHFFVTAFKDRFSLPNIKHSAYVRETDALKDDDSQD